MKNTLSLLLLCILPFTALCQKTSFGLKLGYTSAKLVGQVYGQDGKSAAIININPAAYLNIDYGRFGIQTGLAYMLKGGTGFSTSASFTASDFTYQALISELKLYYLEIPLNAVVNFPIKSGKFFVGAGPYVAYALSGKYANYTAIYNINSGNSTQNNTSTPVSFGSGANDFKRFDLGLNALGGFRFKNGIDLGLRYDLGLTSVTNDANVKAKNVAASVTLGYFFK